jgi:hypothetical protein
VLHKNLAPQIFFGLLLVCGAVLENGAQAVIIKE